MSNTYGQEVIDLLGQVRKLNTRMVLFQQNAAHSLGVIHTDLKTADILNELGPMTAGELAKETGLSTGSVTALIDRLEQAGYVKREKDPQDRRRVIIVPDQENQAEIKGLYEPLVQSIAQLSSKYSEEELALILDFVEEMTHVYQAENQRISVKD